MFAIASADPRLTANAANTEMFMLLPMVASVYCMLRALEAESGMRWWVLCGALAAAACWFKQVAAANALYVAALPAAEGLLRAWMLVFSSAERMQSSAASGLPSHTPS